LPEKTIYAHIISDRAAFFDKRGVKGQGHFFFAGNKLFFYKIARKNKKKSMLKFPLPEQPLLTLVGSKVSVIFFGWQWTFFVKKKKPEKTMHAKTFSLNFCYLSNRFSSMQVHMLGSSFIFFLFFGWKWTIFA